MLSNLRDFIGQKPINIAIYCQNGYNSATSIDFTKMCYYNKIRNCCPSVDNPACRIDLSKPHYPSPRTKLASLVKGEVLLPEKIRATTGGIVFLPHSFRFSDTSANNPSIVGSASHCNRSSPLHKGAKGDTALPTLFKTALSYEKHNILARPRKRVNFCCSA